MNHEPHELGMPLLYAKEVYEIQGATFEVNKELGVGFLEAVYRECLALEFGARGIPFLAVAGAVVQGAGAAGSVSV
jgi:GxxExxY protein